MSNTENPRTSPDEPLKLAERCADFDRKLRSIADNTNLSVDGQTRAVALLTTINGDLFARCVAALKASTSQ